MEQNEQDNSGQPTPSQNTNQSFWEKNQNYIIGGVIVLLLIIYFSTKNPDSNQNQAGENNEQKQEQAAENTGENMEKKEDAAKPGDTAMEKEDKPGEVMGTADGKVTLQGTLQSSDDASKGNVILMSGNTKIYLKSSQDWSSLYGKQVKISGNSNINNFTFLGITEVK